MMAVQARCREFADAQSIEAPAAARSCGDQLDVGDASMNTTVASNAWGEIIHHETEGILELRWLPVKMTDGAFKATLALQRWKPSGYGRRFY
jgi:hypothetical protein